YHPTAKFSTWLFTIANHLALNALRGRQRRPVLPLPASESGPLGPRPAEQLVHARTEPPGQHLQQEELAAPIRRALDGLNDPRRSGGGPPLEELVAYLDGELGEQETETVEAQISLNPAVRREAEALRKTWDLLDYLPRPQPATDFTNRTLSRLDLAALARPAP